MPLSLQPLQTKASPVSSLERVRVWADRRPGRIHGNRGAGLRHNRIHPGPPKRVGVPIAVAVLTVAGLAGLLRPEAARAASVRVEGERPVASTMHRNPTWYDLVRREQFSGGDFISHWDATKAGEATYRVVLPADGSYDLWVRSEPDRLAALVPD